MRIDTAATRGGLRRLLGGLHQAGTLALRAAADAGVASAKATTLFRDRTGDTRASVRGQVFGRAGFVEARGAARFLEYGTRPHRIDSAVMIPGVGWRFIGLHKGTFPRPFMHEARNRAADAAGVAGEYFVNFAIERA